MTDNITNQASINIPQTINYVDLQNDTLSSANNASSSESFNDLSDVFNTITSDILTAISINNTNISSTANIVPSAPSIASDGSSSSSISSDGEASSPALKAAPFSEPVTDELIEKLKEDGNTIKLGNISYKTK